MKKSQDRTEQNGILLTKYKIPLDTRRQYIVEIRKNRTFCPKIEPLLDDSFYLSHLYIINQ